jgi:hypothetical protein
MKENEGGMRTFKAHGEMRKIRKILRDKSEGQRPL